MADALLVAFLATCALSFAMAFALFAIKVAHRRRLAQQEERRTNYIAALSDVVARNAVPARPPAEWVSDPVFLDVVFEYITMVTGAGRKTLHQLIDLLDIRTHLTLEVQSSRRARNRLRALIYLVEIADSGQRTMFHDCLSDPIAEVRLHAARGLAVIADDESIPQLLEMLQKETPWNTGRLADILVGFGSSAVPWLTSYLAREVPNSANPDALREIIRAVGLIGALEAEPVLLELLEADEPLLRVGAASALAHCGTPMSVPALVTALDDLDWRVRARTADALSTLSDGRAVEPLVKRLRDPAWWVRQNAAEALAEIPGGIARLADALADEDRFCRDAARYQLGKKQVIRAARHRIESGIGTSLDRRILAASQTTIEDLLEAPGSVPVSPSRRILVGDGVVDRLKAFAADSTVQLVERLRRLRLNMLDDGDRFPSFEDAGGAGPYQPGRAGGGGFRPVGGQFTTPTLLAREEARVRAALEQELGSIDGGTES
jgi:HEAT repeat protein